MRGLVRLVPILVYALSLPSVVYGQASIAGAVKDTSGAVLPGVTVEASSPVLIERSRSAVTDGMGQYRIIDLDPGVYAVTFTLTGFNTLKREGIELTGSFVATVNAELRVGAVTETITVTGETPIIDVQSSKGQQTLKQDIINAIPTGRTYFGLAVLVPGITTSTQDVGGIAGPATVTYSNHGGPLTEGRLQVDGMSVGSAVGGSGVSYYVADVGHAQEIVFSTAGGLGEAEVGGPVMSIVPSSGGNTIRGSFFANYANGAMQGSNYTQALKNAGLTAPNSLINVWDTNGAFGGPIVKDRLWYYWAGRLQGNQSYVTGMYYNLNAGNPTAWTYAPDLSRQAIQDGSWKNTSLRLTLQPTSRNKINLFWDEQRVCLNCVLGGDAVDSPEAASTTQGHPTRVQQATWTSPVTNKLLLEAGFGTYLSHFGGPERPGNPVDLVRVTEQGGSIPGLTYRSQNWSSSHSGNHNWRASASYVTGAHVLKVGYNGAFISYNTIPFTDNEDLAYRFNNGVPNQLTMTAGPFYTLENVQTTALYAQDQSRLGRLTLQGAVRYDHASGSYLTEQVGPTVFVPNGLTFPGGEGVPGYNDISPRAGAAYDLFGNGKTALKMTMGKYVDAASHNGLYAGTNPVNRIATSTTRSWTDANHNFMPDCNLLNPAANGECGPDANQTFGTSVFNSTFDPAILQGWDVRAHDWNLGLSVQQQLNARLSVQATYNWRWFQNFFVTDNLSVAPSDFTPFTITAPADPRLPGGGGNVISGLYDVAPAKFGSINNFVTKAGNFGSDTQHWQGLDITVNARASAGVTLQGGLSTGRTETNSCAIAAALPETLISGTTVTPAQYCNVVTPFLTQVKALSSYTIPKITVLISATFQSNPGASLAANYNVPNAVIAPSLERNLSGGANATINLVAPGTLYGDRVNQLDFRAAKLLKFGRARTQVSFDLYNALNSDATLTYNQTYVPKGSWLIPTLVIPARFAKVSVQLNF